LVVEQRLTILFCKRTIKKLLKKQSEFYTQRSTISSANAMRWQKVK